MEFSVSSQDDSGSRLLRSSHRSTSGTSTTSHTNNANCNKAHRPRMASKMSTSAAAVISDLNRLKFASLGLYGRDEQLATLRAALERLGVSNSQEEQFLNLVLLAGPSGSGKSAIVKEFSRHLQTKNSNNHNTLLFVSGKFEQHFATPYGAFVSAFTQLCCDLPNHHRHDFAAMQESIQQAVGADCQLLQNLVPKIGELLGRDNNNNKEQQDDDEPDFYDGDKEGEEEEEQESFDIVKSTNRLKYLLQRFLSAVCTPEHKLVLFLDDLQWVDAASLDLFEMILTDAALEESLLVIGAYRDNEVSDQHVFAERLRRIQGKRGQLAPCMTIENLSPQMVHDFITDLLNTDASETKELAEIAYKKVNGNIFFLIQFLTALRDGGYLTCNLGTMKWTWDDSVIRKSTVVSDNVLAILMEKMARLPERLKRVLLIATCLGACFDEIVINLLVKGLEEPGQPESDESTRETLQAIVQEGLLEQLPDRFGSRSYCFVHDQIELAAQSLLDESTIPQLKLQIGRILYDNRSQFDYRGLLFSIVDFWNDGQELITEEDEVKLLTNLNFQAGKKALESSAFEASTRYLRKAIDMIPQAERWTEHYGLSLELHNALLKAEYSNANWEALHDDINIVLAQTDRPVLDKIVAYSTMITTLSSHEHKHLEAIALAVDVLYQLGVTFRPSLGKLGVVGGLIKTKCLLRKLPLEGVLDQVEITDEKKLVALDIVTTTTSSLYASNPDLYMCTVLKTLRWSLKYGISKHSSRCVALYGLVEMALGSIESGTKACEIAVKLAEKQGLMASEFAPITMVYGFVYPWTRSLHACGNHLLTGYNVGLESGDLEYAFINIVMYCFFCFSSGKPLSDLEADMRDYARQMREFSMTLQLQFLCLTWQTVLNLMGRTDDPMVLSGEAMSQEEMLQAAEKDKNPPLQAQLYCHRLQLAVYYGEYDVAASLIRPSSSIGTVNPGNPIVWRTALFEGIAAFEMVRQGKRKWRGTGMKAMSKVHKWVEAGNVNCVHIMFLLQAEEVACKGNIKEAHKLYDKAIATAARNGFRNDRALACERCERMFDKSGDEEWATEYFKQAHEAYTEMEAFGKIDHMNRQRDALRPTIDFGVLEKEAGPGPVDGGTLWTGETSGSLYPED